MPAVVSTTTPLWRGRTGGASGGGAGSVVSGSEVLPSGADVEIWTFASGASSAWASAEAPASMDESPRLHPSVTAAIRTPRRYHRGHRP